MIIIIIIILLLAKITVNDEKKLFPDFETEDMIAFKQKVT